MICSQMHSHDDWKLPEDVARDLAALARTAKLFRESALNALWAYQATFAYVLRCFPSDLWNMPVLLGSLNDLVRLTLPARIIPNGFARGSPGPCHWQTGKDLCSI
jgi:hypothetical protein